jgi:hypothetical protein
MSQVKDLEAYVNSQAAIGPYQFARAFRVMSDGMPYSIFSREHFYPYLWDVFETIRNMKIAERLIVAKASQSGWTEVAIAFVLWFMAVKHEGVLYMLPSEAQLGDFAKARIDTMISLSPKIQAAFSSTDNAGLKVGWSQALYLRGSNSRSKLREIPVGLLVRDEHEDMDLEGREQARSRLGASQHQFIFDIGNPRYPETGIHKEFLLGTQEEFSIKCPKCHLDTPPRWPDSCSKEHPRNVVCPDCHTRLDLQERWSAGAARWVAGAPDAPHRSFTHSKLITPSVYIPALFQEFEEAQHDNTKTQIFYNNALGLPYAAAGARIDETVINRLKRHGPMTLGFNGPATMGVDVGKRLHVVVRRQDGGILWVGTTDWDSLPMLMHDFGVSTCGIDIRPETNEAKKFARAFLGRVTLIAYNPNAGATGQQESEDEGIKILTVGRTEAIDAAFALFFSGEESIPDNLPDEFFHHLKSMTRQIVHEASRNESARVPRDFAAWVESGDDHYGHSFVYSELVRRGGSPFSRAQLFPGGPEPGEEEEPQSMSLQSRLARARGMADPGWGG